MCGISGIITFQTYDKEIFINDVRNVLNHRGPDNFDYWIDDSNGLTLLHNRLSIVDLSSQSNQPKTSIDDRYVLCFNGEIYNFRDLVSDINKDLIINSDTELILHAFSKYGIKDSINKFIGMFAIAVWDKQEEKLTLIRDRMGEKPLYYGLIDNCFIFSSELKSFKKFPLINLNINNKSVNYYFSRMNVPAPFTIYNNIFKLEPGGLLEFKPNDLKNKNVYIKNNELFANKIKAKQTWWSALKLFNTKNFQPNNYSNTKKQITSILNTSVENMLKTDVKNGVFLSGGIDSSLIAAIAKKIDNNISTFSVRFNDLEFDESKFAYEIANKLKTNHHEITIDKEELIDTITKIPSIFDEPFSDSSSIPSYLLCSKVSNFVKVALSGDGGDELFGGYNRYIYLEKILARINYLPFIIRRNISSFFLLLPNKVLKKIFSFLITSSEKNILNFEKNIQNLLKSLSISYSDYDTYLNILSNSDYTSNINDYKYLNNLLERKTTHIKKKFINKIMFSDIISYLPDDILVKVDRTSMSNSLEVRAPFLDYKLVEFSSKIPFDYKIKKNSGKIIIKDILSNYIPENLINRPKQGFAVPLSKWLKNELREWSENKLEKISENSNKYLNYKKVYKLWNDHLNEKKDNSSVLWTIFIFQSWYERQYDE